jgi:uncharacterized protein (TIRG00374 family)
VRTHLRTGLVSLLALGLFGWFLRSANLGNVWSAVRSARVDLLVLAFVLVALTYWARALRWQYLLGPIGRTRFRTAFRTTVIGFAASFLLPARAGDVLRPYLLARQEGLSASATFATIVFERVLDMITVLILLALYAWGGPGRDIPAALLRPVQVSAAVGGAISLGVLGVMFMLASHPERVGTLVLGMNRVLPHRLAHALSGFARAFSQGLAVARTPRPLATALAWSFPLWLLIALQAWCVTRAFGIGMPVAGSFLLQALLVIGVAVPTPGAVGGFHEAYRVGVTTFFQASNDAAVGGAIVLHALSFVPVTLLGLYFMARDGLSVVGLQSLAREAHDAEVPQS